jgi:hypothetical protein
MVDYLSLTAQPASATIGHTHGAACGPGVSPAKDGEGNSKEGVDNAVEGMSNTGQKLDSW